MERRSFIGGGSQCDLGEIGVVIRGMLLDDPEGGHGALGKERVVEL